MHFARLRHSTTSRGGNGRVVAVAPEDIAVPRVNDKTAVARSRMNLVGTGWLVENRPMAFRMHSRIGRIRRSSCRAKHAAAWWSSAVRW